LEALRQPILPSLGHPGNILLHGLIRSWAAAFFAQILLLAHLLPLSSVSTFAAWQM